MVEPVAVKLNLSDLRQSVWILDEGTLKTPTPKCRLYRLFGYSTPPQPHTFSLGTGGGGGQRENQRGNSTQV